MRISVGIEVDGASDLRALRDWWNAPLAHLMRQATAQETAQMTAIDNLASELAENTDAVSSAAQLLDSIKAQLDEAIRSGDMSRVQELSDQLSANTDALAAAVARNTPAAPANSGDPAQGGDGGHGGQTGEATTQG